MIVIDAKIPDSCVECPCSHWIQSGEYEGMLMCNLLEYMENRNIGTEHFLVDEFADSRPLITCPMKSEKDREIWIQDRMVM